MLVRVLQRRHAASWSSSRPPPRGGGRRPGRPSRNAASWACRCRAAGPPAAARDPGRPPPGRSPAPGRSASARRRPCAGGARPAPAAASGSSGRTWSARPVSDEEPQALAGVAERISLFSSSRTRSAETISMRSAIAFMRRDDLGGHLEVQLRGEAGGPHHPQRIVGEGLLRRSGRAQHALRQVVADRRAGRRTPSPAGRRPWRSP